MSEIKEVRNKIKCITNTQKITKAMEMVSISKMKKAEVKMNSGRPYLKTIKEIINNFISNNTRYQHVYLEQRAVKKIGIIIISTDRGLCGNLNVTLFKKILDFIQNYNNRNITSDLSILGLKGLSFFKSLSNKIVYFNDYAKNNYTFSDCLNCNSIFMKLYSIGEIDRLFLAYNKFKSTLIQIPSIIQLLPLSKKKIHCHNNHWDYIYESDSKLLLNKLLNNYLEFQIYQASLENYTSEQAARMIAMKQATDNSKDLIRELQIIYNKARQDNITQELTEIVSGAAAISLN
ncbi:ATP synthase F1 subunit gamma [Buchnera aphidicola]|uniref:ATP synthase gamma chain n=2 Tax=Buchnera aphidicola subsp. Melaphis rhois TaxID=118103 RepID=ATPG_BUCMH|nr:ATP synthase F1 subunit gamma [Buchnera aphidicola]Q9RQ74.1 RecName: Full=ATP synthase gamma chain; AltName: Full=ATP synthase F1 sector gamma subunit; AltName: Full=F-ATPase gamma subunit [Buchnera aphidicola (Melaphis rhois)]AAF13784.1 gamma subunit of membrane-bound ATP synthase [Buchnera aphidicola]QCI23061.1 ATP synthase F1 subunit gamma [Buchnera aphidicola (Melaphis rhois)]